ncbi:MAG: hypothetical protein AVDCRST_MAG05-3938, partial [uncultured Rubrobacteraceae bacterium]
ERGGTRRGARRTRRDAPDGGERTGGRRGPARSDRAARARPRRPARLVVGGRPRQPGPLDARREEHALPQAAPRDEAAGGGWLRGHRTVLCFRTLIVL